MADLMACPGCNATLRVPAGSEMIRCPRCKAEVTVKAKAVPVAKAIPLSPPVKPAIPLPFEKPAVTAPAPVPVAKALPLDKAVVRSKVVREDDERDEPRPKKNRERFEDSIKSHPSYTRVDFECRMARVGVYILAGAAIVSALQMLCYGMFLGLLAGGSPYGVVLIMPATIFLGVQCLLFVIGYGFCIAGPRGMRSTAVIGLITTLMHAGLIIPLAIYGFALMTDFERQADDAPHTVVSRLIFVFSAFMNNQSCFTDFPWMVIRGDFNIKEWLYIVLMVSGGIFEFAKMCVLGTLVQYYASEGKSHELGFRSLRFVYRIIWVIIAVGALKLLTLAGVYAFFGENDGNIIFLIPQALYTVGFFLWWVFAWLAQYRAMREAIDVITAPRFLDKRATIDEYY